MKELKNDIELSLKQFAEGNITDNAFKLFKTLAYDTSQNISSETTSYQHFYDGFVANSQNKERFNPQKALSTDWLAFNFLFQLDENLAGVAGGKVQNQEMYSAAFACLELKNQHYSRSQLAEITRQINLIFVMPVVVLFKYDNKITLSVIHRRINKKDEQKDVLEKVSLIKDIAIDKPHRAQIEILNDFAFSNLTKNKKLQNFVELTNAWEQVFSTKKLNNDFYQELFKWYLYAKDNVTFPNDNNEEADKYLSESLIRFISRMLFVWFMKEKSLITNQIFQLNDIKDIIKDFDEKSDKNIYYKAILQNLFFATLNVPTENREWIASKRKNKEQKGNPLIYRFENEFINSEKIITEIFNKIPFLNGGLFDCLDDRENKKFTDGFTKTEKKQPKFPNYLFFGEHKDIDLSHHFADDAKVKRKWQNQHIVGIIDLLNDYKFTIEENTPLEIDVALDPELLGKVFENLLASFNPETKDTARKQTGSFYTPREIVNYMVEESLIAYLKNKLLHEEAGFVELGKDQITLFGNEIKKSQLKFEVKIDKSPFTEKELEKMLRQFVSSMTINPFAEMEEVQKKIIKALNSCKILDPACGSGAYPMGVLHKMVELLTVLDPENKHLKEIEGKKLDQLIEGAKALNETNTRNQTIAALQKQKEILQKSEYDYVRKLYIIENCIYGVDIQPIAIQISKLRFFISLLVEQNKKEDQPNFGIEPLPNMDFKLVAANTLIAPPQEDKNIGGLFADQNEFFDRFEALAHDYFTLHTPDAKKQKKKEIEALIISKVEEKKKTILRQADVGKKATQIEESLKLWESYPNLFKEKAVGFFETPYFFPKVKDGFDVVIGNPPYVLVKDDYLKSNYLSANDGKINLYKVFIEQSFNLLRKSGVMYFINPNTYLTSNDSKKIRSLIINEKQIIDIIEYSEKDSVFENVTQAVTILGIKNSFIKKNKFLLQSSKQGKNLVNQSDFLLLNNHMIIYIDDVIRKLLLLKNKFKNVANSYQGEINLTIKKDFFNFENSDKKLPMIRGNNIDKFVMTGKILEYCELKADDRLHYLHNRIITQQVSNQSQQFRTKALLLEQNIFCGNSTNYILINIVVR